MQQDLLRAQHGNGRLLGDQRGGLERSLDDLVPPPFHDTRDEPNGQGLCGGEVARGESELGRERLVAGDFGETSERPDVCCKPDVNFLQRMDQKRLAREIYGIRPEKWNGKTEREAERRLITDLHYPL